MKLTLKNQLQSFIQYLQTNQVLRIAFRTMLLLSAFSFIYSCEDHGDPLPLNSDKILTQKIDSISRSSMEKGTAPGMSIVVIKNGKLSFQKNYGYADIDDKIPVTNESPFAIGSTTKAMTAMGVLSLVDKGLIKLNEKVITYIPDLVMKDSRYKNITVKHLLSNTSGIRSFGELAPPSDALENILNVLANEELEFEPGQGFYYSNYGFTLAGLLIQRISKQPYEEYMDNFLFDKIGMHNTTMEYWRPNSLGTTKGYVLDSVAGYVETAPYFDRAYNPAGGGTILNSNDLGLYLTTLVNGLKTSSGLKLLSDSLTTQMFAGTVNVDNDALVQFIGAKGNYGYGWYNINRNGFKTIEHGGNILSMLSYIILDPNTKSAVGLMINQEDYSKISTAAEIAKTVFNAN